MSANLKLHNNVGGITEKYEGKYEHDFSSLYQGWTQIGKNANKKLKVGLSPCKKSFFICFNESPLNMMKNVFLFHISKALFTLKIFKILYWLWSYRKTALIRKLMLISKFVTSQTGQQVITIHILPNISRSKVMRNIFLVKSYTKCGGEARSRPSYKKLKLSISLDQESEML